MSGRCCLLLMTITLCTKQGFADGQQMTSGNLRNVNAYEDPMAVFLTILKQLQQSNAAMNQEIDTIQQQLQQLSELAVKGSKQTGFCDNASRPRDCADVKNLGSTSSGVYTVYVGNTLRPLSVYCDMQTDNGGWTVFQRRQDGSENFYRNWFDYANGFGKLLGEFWLGNDNIYLLTNGGKQYKLRIDLGDFNGNTRYAEYADFKIGSAWDKYKAVSVGAYNGTAGNSFVDVVGYKFSTIDQDNDIYDRSCAAEFKGAWWYNKCHESNLNGFYYGGPHKSFADGIEWKAWTGFYYSLRWTEMKIRPV